jgi:hypothetical protein
MVVQCPRNDSARPYGARKQDRNAVPGLRCAPPWAIFTSSLREDCGRSRVGANREDCGRSSVSGRTGKTADDPPFRGEPGRLRPILRFGANREDCGRSSVSGRTGKIAADPPFRGEPGRLRTILRFGANWEDCGRSSVSGRTKSVEATGDVHAIARQANLARFLRGVWGAYGGVKSARI